MNHSSQFIRMFLSICLALLIFSVSVYVIYGGYSLLQSFAQDSEKKQTAFSSTPSEEKETPTEDTPTSPFTPSESKIGEQIDRKNGSEERKDSPVSENDSDSVASAPPTKPWKETVKIQIDKRMKEGNTYYLKKGQKVKMKIYSVPMGQANHRINATLRGPGDMPYHLSHYGVTKEFQDTIPQDGMYTLVVECNYKRHADCSGKATFWVVKEDSD